jgi:hypothetical protein
MYGGMHDPSFRLQNRPFSLGHLLCGTPGILRLRMTVQGFSLPIRFAWLQRPDFLAEASSAEQ